MKNVFALGFLSAIFAFTATSALAETAPAGCSFQFKVKINSYLVFSEGSGTGTVTCADAAGRQTTSAPVSISINSLGLGLGEFEMEGITGNLGILDPKEIVGTYAIAEANVGIGSAVGANLGFEGQNHGLSFAAALSKGKGWGARINGSTWEITLQ